MMRRVMSFKARRLHGGSSGNNNNQENFLPPPSSATASLLRAAMTSAVSCTNLTPVVASITGAGARAGTADTASKGDGNAGPSTPASSVWRP